MLRVFAIPNCGIYNASKFAVERPAGRYVAGLAAHGIKATLVEPAGYATDQQPVVGQDLGS